MVPYKRPGNLLAGLITVTDTQIDPYVLGQKRRYKTQLSTTTAKPAFSFWVFFFFVAAILDAP